MTRASLRRRVGVAVAVAAVAGATAFALPAGARPAPSAKHASHTIHACAPASSGFATCFAEIVRSPRRAGVARGIAGARATDAAVPPPKRGYGPADIKRIYGLDTTGGTGMTVGIVDAYDNPEAASNLASFRAAYGLPACTIANHCFTKVNQRGGAKPPAADSGWGLEIALDLQAVSSACPNCKILLVEADNPSTRNLGLAENRAVEMGADVVSNSYGGSEYTGITAVAKKYYEHAGIPIVASTGDEGFSSAAFPSSVGSTIAVGGTTVRKTSGGYRQSAWYGGGSGCSAYFPKPAWQHDKHCLMRTTSDISADADPATGLAVYDTFKTQQLGVKPGWIVVGGTSLSAPLVSAMIALAGNPAQLATPAYIYRHRGGLLDVTRGTNGIFQGCGGDYLCKAKPGYDGPTGLGTPVGLSAL